MSRRRYQGSFMSGTYRPFLTPNAPTAVTATAGNASASVSFTAPANVGGAAITSYRVVSSAGQSATGAASPITVTGLTNGVAYTFTVYAENTYGPGPYSSPSNSVTPAPSATIDYLLVAGGGGGGAHVGGGGGGGGFRSGSSITISTGVAIPITVGAGGTSPGTNQRGNVGGVSTIVLNGSTITSSGGGGGGTWMGAGNATGVNGASGGGAAGTDGYDSASGGTGISGQGFAGGSVGPREDQENSSGAGGGGAAAVGGSRNPAWSDALVYGGAGAASSILGTTYYFAGGGGPGTYAYVIGGYGGIGGGGGGGSFSYAGGVGGGSALNSGANGGLGNSTNGGAGGANTGGGGGGGTGGGGSVGGSGGSGICVIRSTSQAASTTGSPTVTTSGGFYIYRFNSSGSITF